MSRSQQLSRLVRLTGTVVTERGPSRPTFLTLGGRPGPTAAGGSLRPFHFPGDANGPGRNFSSSSRIALQQDGTSQRDPCRVAARRRTDPGPAQDPGLHLPLHEHEHQQDANNSSSSSSNNNNNNSSNENHNNQAAAAPPAFPPRPRRSLEGKVAIVTGSGTRHPAVPGLGNGTAIALLLAEAGAAVVCADADLVRAEATASLVGRERGGQGQALAVRADVTEARDCEGVVRRALAWKGRLDVLVNVVGVLGARGDATTVDAGEWARGLELNVTSMMLMSKHAIPAMRLNNDDGGDGGGGDARGSIVNIGSVAGLRGGTPHLLYPTSKGAVVNLTRAMAAHHGHEGVRVNCVCPGMLYTPMMAYGAATATATVMTPQAREARRKRSLLQTEGSAWDCAAAVRFLAGEEARWITGAVLVVDAGATASTWIPNVG